MKGAPKTKMKVRRLTTWVYGKGMRRFSTCERQGETDEEKEGKDRER